MNPKIDLESNLERLILESKHNLKLVLDQLIFHFSGNYLKK